MTSNVKENALFDNEMDFCRCAGEENKDILEDLFLRNRISYFIKWQKKSFFGRIFQSRRPDVVVFRINKRDVAAIIGAVPEEDWSPKRAIHEREQK